jgi:hypothetical protein
VFREVLRGAAFTNSSSVFAEPCAQHALAMMLALYGTSGGFAVVEWSDGFALEVCFDCIVSA